MNQFRQEYRAVLLLAVLFLFFLFQAVLPARAEVRDDLRRQDITNLKRSLEQYFNQYGYYPTPPGGLPACTSSSPESWFFSGASPLLQEQYIDAIPHDVRENRGYHYSYCVTTHDGSGRTQGYYLQAQLERPEAQQRSFDEDEARKFYFRVLQERGQVFYRVCGGSEKQCEG